MLLLSLGRVDAQTATPTPPPFITGVPPTATPQQGAGNGQMSTIGFNFQSGPAGFDDVFGEWSAGLGFQSELGLLAIYGGFRMTDVAVVSLLYSNLDAGSLELRLCEPGNALCGTEVFSDVSSVPVCPDSTCLKIWFVPSIASDRIQISWESDTAPDGYFLARVLTVDFRAAVDTFPVDDNGCPVMGVDDVNLLDAAYRSQCSRCFSTPQPGFSKMLSPEPLTAVATLNPTAQGTYSIPIVITVGGTVEFITATSRFEPTLTRTPTATPTSIYAPTWTPNPSFSSQNYFVCAVTTCAPDPALDPFDDGGQYDSQTRRINPGGVRVQLGNYRWVGGINVTFKAPAPTWNTFQIHAAGTYSPVVTVNKNSPNNLRTQGISFTAPIFTDYVDLLPVDSNGGAPLRTQYIAVLYSAASTPLPVSTATSTPQATIDWIKQPTYSPVDCSVPQFRDDTPVAALPVHFDVVNYQCYTIVPEIEIVALEPDFIIDGTSICVTFFAFPVVDILGITVSLDWVLIIVAAYLVRMLLKF